MELNKEYLTHPLASLFAKVILANFIKPREPFKVTFALTYKCNSKCRYCNTWLRPEREELAIKDVKKILQTMPEVKWLHLTGGEIFLREDIHEILDFVMHGKKLAIVTLATNGILTEKIVAILRQIGRGRNIPKIYVTCSLDGAKDSYIRLRRVAGGYEKCLSTFIELRRIRNINAYLSVTLSMDNYLDVPVIVEEMARRLGSFSFSEIHLNFLNNSFFYNHKQSVPENKKISLEVFNIVNKLRAENSGTGIRNFLEGTYFKLMPRFIESGKSPIPCNSLSCSCFIDPYANIYPCINFEKKIGNLEETGYNFRELWTRRYRNIQDIERQIRSRLCPGCWTPCEAYPSILTNLLH